MNVQLILHIKEQREMAINIRNASHGIHVTSMAKQEFDQRYVHQYMLMYQMNILENIFNEYT